jgi:hypothetical protein
MPLLLFDDGSLSASYGAHQVFLTAALDSEQLLGLNLAPVGESRLGKDFPMQTSKALGEQTSE